MAIDHDEERGWDHQMGYIKVSAIVKISQHLLRRQKTNLFKVTSYMGTFSLIKIAIIQQHVHHLSIVKSTFSYYIAVNIGESSVKTTLADIRGLVRQRKVSSLIAHTKQC